jgi:hypothetical protein
MKNIKLYFLIFFLSLLFFSNNSFGFETLSLQSTSSDYNTQNIKREYSINSVFDKYNPLRLFSLEQKFKRNFEVNHSISFDKKTNDPFSFDLNDSSLDEKKIQLNITVRF